MSSYLLAIDQGTTNSRAIIFDKAGKVIAHHELPLKQSFPHDGWVEQDPLEMFENITRCCRAVLTQSGLTAKSIAAAGITNQRETTIIWDKKTGQPIYPAISWQDRRTDNLCKQLSQTISAETLQEKTGLLLDPYFSATKIMWLLENVEGARERALHGELLFGTVDTYLLWKLTQGASHFTDASNASRTLLFNIRTQSWDLEILKQLNIPKDILPQVLDNTANFGEIHESILGEKILVAGMAGDQQAAAIGQACFSAGMAKITYGTGGFLLLNTAEKIVRSNNKLLTTIAYRIHDKPVYGLEGSIFSAGSTVKWLRDKLKLITHASETEECARQIASTEGCYFVPAFNGLGAPYWDPEARAAILGLTQHTNKNHIVRAGLESVAYQTYDLLHAMFLDSQFDIKTLRVDGGMAANNWLLQFLSDLLQIKVQRPASVETTALGAAYLAGLQIGMYASLEEIAKLWEINADFTPKMPLKECQKLHAGWEKAVSRISKMNMLC